MAKAIGYRRVSTEGQEASGAGLAAQGESLAASASSMGLSLEEVLTDVVSGSTGLEKRPGLLEAVSKLKKGDVLLVAKRDRLARDPIVSAMVERLVAKRGARIVSAAGEGTGDDDPTSILMRRIVDAFAEYERLLIGARTKAALQAKKAKGERVGMIPFGFRLGEDGRLEEEPEEQATRAAVLNARGRGLSQRKIAAELKARGFTGRTGRPLSQTQVCRILAA